MLVVDDDADVRMLLTMCLALNGFVAEEADSAAAALGPSGAGALIWCGSTS